MTNQCKAGKSQQEVKLLIDDTEHPLPMLLSSCQLLFQHEIDNLPTQISNCNNCISR